MKSEVAIEPTSLDGSDTHLSSSSMAARSILWILIGVALAQQLIDKLWLMNQIATNSDSAVDALQAQMILHGHFNALSIGGTYGGVEPYITALFFAFLPNNSIVLHMPPVLCGLVGAYFIWRIGTRIIGDTWAPLGLAALTLLFPISNLMTLFLVYGFRDVTYVCVFATLLLAVRIIQESDLTWRWLLLGAVAGLGWWSSPEEIYGIAGALIFLAPLLWGIRTNLKGVALRIGVTAGAFFAASLPWWWYSVQNNWITLHYQGQHTSPAFRAHMLLDYTLPMQWGLRQYDSGSLLWVSASIHLAVIGAMILVLAAAVVLAIRAGGLRRSLGITTIAVPILYIASPTTWYWQDGRYAIYLAPFFLLTLVVGVQEAVRLLPRWRRHVQPVTWGFVSLLLVLGISSSGWQFSVLSAPLAANYNSTRFVPFGDFSTTNGGLQGQANMLVARGVHTGWADYWSAYNIDFQDSRLQLSPTPNDVLRIPTTAQAVLDNPNSIWLVWSPGGASGTQPLASDVAPGMLSWSQLAARFSSRGVAWSATPSGHYWIIRTSRQVTPDQIGLG
jgi:Dolichyl-phosphate-mannose-protein mannosyltransferase